MNLALTNKTTITTAPQKPSFKAIWFGDVRNPTKRLSNYYGRETKYYLLNLKKQEEECFYPLNFTKGIKGIYLKAEAIDFYKSPNDNEGFFSNYRQNNPEKIREATLNLVDRISNMMKRLNIVPDKSDLCAEVGFLDNHEESGHFLTRLQIRLEQGNNSPSVTDRWHPDLTNQTNLNHRLKRLYKHVDIMRRELSMKK